MNTLKERKRFIESKSGTKITKWHRIENNGNDILLGEVDGKLFDESGKNYKEGGFFDEFIKPQLT